MTVTGKPSWEENRARLRTNAEALIQDGAATIAGTGSGALGVDALELLYRRASDPEFAADALKLLHELQTHQVELDMLLEQLQASESELTDELARYQALYSLAPVAYLILSCNGIVIESNTAARTLLGFTPEHSEEQTLTQSLAPPGRATLVRLLETLTVPGSVATCKAKLAGCSDHDIFINASLGPSGDQVMMAMFQCPVPDIVTARS